MSFADSVRTCLTLKYMDFSGRARRSEYWWFFLFNILLSIVVNVIASAIHLGFLTYLVSLALLLPGLSVAVRRLHDTGKSGWWLLIGLIPLIGAIVLIVFFVMDTSPAGDTYGPSPTAVTYQG
jgi:uncharacterized membrane protein YhaH (DUF805 family)